MQVFLAGAPDGISSGGSFEADGAPLCQSVVGPFLKDKSFSFHLSFTGRTLMVWYSTARSGINKASTSDKTLMQECCVKLHFCPFQENSESEDSLVFASWDLDAEEKQLDGGGKGIEPSVRHYGPPGLHVIIYHGAKVLQSSFNVLPSTY